jgi:hypothetical protein
MVTRTTAGGQQRSRTYIEVSGPAWLLAGRGAGLLAVEGPLLLTDAKADDCSKIQFRQLR